MVNKRKRVWLVSLIILAIVGIGIFFFTRDKKDKDSAGDFTGETPGTTQVSETEKESETETASSTASTESDRIETDVYPETDPVSGLVIYGDDYHPKAPKLPFLSNLSVPDYDGKPYVMLNDGEPFFDVTVLRPESYEIYYDLDDLGRCTLADAVVGRDLMPVKKRGSISSVKPTGWHSDKYSRKLVDGENLYNRCHLIAFGLCGETANPYNLVTGTRYFNTKGVNDFENLVIDYVRETGNHVRYRVTPVFVGDELVCRGQVIEAWSIEDEGEAICFNIYAYNVQPGVCIDYTTGDNWLDGSDRPKETEGKKKDIAVLEKDYIGDFILNIKSKKIHTTSCESALGMSDKNKKEYTGSLNDLLLEGFGIDHACISLE